MVINFYRTAKLSLCIAVLLIIESWGGKPSLLLIVRNSITRLFLLYFYFVVLLFLASQYNYDFSKERAVISR